MSGPTLADTRVLIVGVGGLGCPASLALARAGVGHLTVVDPDAVDVTNLHRQLWHRDGDVGTPKVTSAAAKLARAFPALKLTCAHGRLEPGNAQALFEAHDLVIDATDGIDVKFLLSDAAVRTGKPLVYGGVLRMQGQAMLIAPGGPCLRCLFETAPEPDDIPTCAQAGVLGSMAGLIGFLQAKLALRHLSSASAVEGTSTLHVFDGGDLRGRAVKVRKAKDCAACAPGREVVLAMPQRSPTCRI